MSPSQKVSPQKVKSSQAELTPRYLLVAILGGFPLVLATGIMQWLQKVNLATDALLTFIISSMVGLSLCFFWRRLPVTPAKHAAGQLFAILHWSFLLAWLGESLLKFFGLQVNFIKTAGLSVLAGHMLVVLIFLSALSTFELRQRRRGSTAVYSAIGFCLAFVWFGFSFLNPSAQKSIKGGEPGVIQAGSAADENFIEPLTAHQKVNGMEQNKGQQESGGKAQPDGLVDLPELAGGSGDPGVDRDRHNTRTWGYHGSDGPSYWGMLQPEFELCDVGKNQSPIEIPRRSKSYKSFVRHKYRSSTLRIEDTGHSIQLTADAGSWLKIKNKKFDLQSIHFHSPSEHQVNGLIYPMEIHFVHKNKQGQLAVLGILVEKGYENKMIDRIWQYLPDEKNSEQVHKKVKINLGHLVPRKTSFWHYQGSLTTPPCTEGVQWTVARTAIEMSAAQISAYRQLYKGTNRPIQDLHSRTIGKPKFTSKVGH